MFSLCFLAENKVDEDLYWAVLGSVLLSAPQGACWHPGAQGRDGVSPRPHLQAGKTYRVKGKGTKAGSRQTSDLTSSGTGGEGCTGAPGGAPEAGRWGRARDKVRIGLYADAQRPLLQGCLWAGVTAARGLGLGPWRSPP